MSAVKAGDAFAVYGLLRKGASGFAQFGLERAFRPLGPCRIPGVIHDLGGYPGLVDGEGAVIGELFEVADPSVIARLDAFEDYYPQAPDRSRYLRRQITLLTPARKAWVYLWNLPVTGFARVESGDWLEWVASKA
ncbi:gamma-glutamylcyclotransferase family protein [Glycocaulis sp.]|uniref:gamma-glutamylcyclotransferase family protein n=1 Tax=Glycocaulis sp. TaxID=1969725 RepID=UPI003F72F3A4